MAAPDGRSQHFGIIGKSGVAKASHFMVTLTTPADGGGIGKDLKNNIGRDFSTNKNNFVTYSTQGTQNIAFRAERVNLPGRIIITSTYKEGNYGLNQEYPTNAVYQPMDITIVMSEDYSEKVFFELWQDLIVGSHRTKGDNVAGTRELNYLRNYACTVTVTAFSDAVGRGRNMQPVYECTLQEAYPRTINDIPLDWGSNENVRMNVVFQYKYFQDNIITNKDSGRQTQRTGGFLATTGLGAGLSAFGGRQLASLSAGTQQRLTGVGLGIGGALGAVRSARSAASSARVASKLFR